MAPPFFLKHCLPLGIMVLIILVFLLPVSTFSFVSFAGSPITHLCLWPKIRAPDQHTQVTVWYLRIHVKPKCQIPKMKCHLPPKSGPLPGNATPLVWLHQPESGAILSTILLQILKSWPPPVFQFVCFYFLAHSQMSLTSPHLCPGRLSPVQVSYSPKPSPGGHSTIKPQASQTADVMSPHPYFMPWKLFSLHWGQWLNLSGSQHLAGPGPSLLANLLDSLPNGSRLIIARLWVPLGSQGPNTLLSCDGRHFAAATTGLSPAATTQVSDCAFPF